MARTVLEALKDRVLTRMAHRYRPFQRTLEQTFASTNEVEIQLHTGSLEILAASNASTLHVIAGFAAVIRTSRTKSRSNRKSKAREPASISPDRLPKITARVPRWMQQSTFRACPYHREELFGARGGNRCGRIVRGALLAWNCRNRSFTQMEWR